MTTTETRDADFTLRDEPFKLFADWMEEARASEINDPNAMSVATVDADGLPNVRMTLLKGFDERGFVFYTNFESQKGTEILGQPKAALGLHWKIIAPSGAGARTGRAGVRCRSGRILQLQTP